MKAALALLATSVLAATFAAGQDAGGGDYQLEKTREWVKQHFPHLVNPEFAKLDLARMLPELNDGPEKLDAPFKAGGAINFRLLVTNNSRERVYLPAAGTYKHNRPQLSQGGEAVPYRREVERLVEREDTWPEYRSIRYEQVESGRTLTEVINLNDWYAPLRPGAYKLTVRHRFIWGGEWLESPPINFEVVP